MNYELIKDGPAPMSWDEYAPILRKEWRELLDKEGTRERDFHNFLERHPCLIPGCDAFTGATGWDNPAGPVNGFVISQPLLPGISRRRPDFMWAPTDSQTQWIVLIEIKDPKKPWFTKGLQRRAELTQAEDQIAEWRECFKEPANRLQFMKLYGIPSPIRLEVVYCLVYGRRMDVATRGAMEKRNSLHDGFGDVKWMTYDRLRPDEDARNYPCVKVSTSRKLTAVTFPPTAEISDWTISRWSKLDGKRDAILNNSPHFSDLRRNFLADRLDYWDEVVASGANIRSIDSRYSE